VWTVLAVEFCLAEQLDIQCGNGEIIAVESARYGRMRLGRCVRTDYGYIGCSTDVTDVLVGRCSGRRRCQVVNIELLMIEVLFAACPADLVSYLEVNYSCIRGRSVSASLCLLVTNLKTCKDPCIAVNRTPSQSYGVSLAIWDHAVLAATRHK